MPAMTQLGKVAKGLTSEELADVLRKNESAAASGEDVTLRDIYGFIDNSGNGAYAHTPNIQAGGEQAWGSTGPGMAYADTQANNGGDGNAAQAPVTFNPHERFREGVSLLSMNNNGEGSGGYRYVVDGDKFPRTAFGDVNATAPVTDATRDLVMDPRLVYNDEHYGEITHGANINNASLSDMIFPAIMAAATGGMGLLGAPALGTMLPGLLQAASNGSIDIGRIAGMIAQYLGVDPQMISLAQLGLNAGGVNTRIDLNGGKKP